MPSPTDPQQDHPGRAPDEFATSDYVQTMAVWSNLVDVRFRVLAIVPVLTAAGVGLLGQVHDLGTLRVTLVALLGLVTVVALTLYDLRNSIFHDFTIHRLKTLEQRLGFQRSVRRWDSPWAEDPHRDLTIPPGPIRLLKGNGTLGGVFAERPGFRTRFLGLRVQHDWALQLAYSASAAAWAALAAYSAAARFDAGSNATQVWVSAGAALLVFGAMTLGFWFHDIRKSFSLHTLTGGVPTNAWPEWPKWKSSALKGERRTRRLVEEHDAIATISTVCSRRPGQPEATGIEDRD